MHYSTDGWLLHNTSDESKKQNDLAKLEAELTAKFQVRGASLLALFLPRLLSLLLLLLLLLLLSA